MKRLPIFLYVILSGIAVSQAVFYYLAMPDPMAAHFGLSGRADNWMSRTAFYVIEGLILLLMFGIFIVMPWALERFKVKKMNLPNREYWLAPGRMEVAYAYFREAFGWFGVVNLLFLIGVMQLVFKANIAPEPVLDNRIFLVLLTGYFIFAAAWIYFFYRKFAKTD